MPRNPNRSIHQLDFSFDFLNKLPPPETLSITGLYQNRTHEAKAKYFGEKVFPEKNSYNGRRSSSKMSYTSSDEHDRIPSGILDFGATSSSSSQDWTEEFDSEATVKVLEEFKRMEMVLCGFKPIPKNYDRDEYQQWMTTFPKSRLVGRQLSSQIASSNSSNRKLISPQCDERGCDCKGITSSSRRSYAKNIAIDEISKNVTTKVFGDKLFGSASEHRTVFRRKKRTIANNKPDGDVELLERQFESVLRVSPISLSESSARTYLDGRRRSPQSVARSELQSSKWMQDDLTEYTFLPYLPNASAKTTSRRLVKQKNVDTLTSASVRKPSENKNHRIFLPPITNLTFSSTYYRSISATPRQQNKLSPAVSAQISSIHKRNFQLNPTNSSLTLSEARRNGSVRYINHM